MNLLIVDDEISAIQAVLKGVDWDDLDFLNLYTASNKQEAIDIISNKQVDIMLSDIEMPMGSGLELLEWVNLNASGIRCIFITCHADFNFAQKAVKLGSLDYILKPLDFEILGQVLKKAAKLVWEEKLLKEHSTSWLHNKETLLKQFWMDFFVGEIAPSEYSVKYYLNQKHLEIALDNNFLPILVSIKKWDETINKEDYKLFLYALRNIVQEIFVLPYTGIEVIPFIDNTLLIMLSRDAQMTFELSEIATKDCNSVINAALKYLKLTICCYIGEPDKIYEIPNQLEELHTMDFNNVAFLQNILFYSQYTDSAVTYKNDIFIHLADLLEGGGFDDAAKEIHHFFDSIDYVNQINREFLGNFHRDFYYLLFAFARKHSLSLDELFTDEESDKLSKNSITSLHGLLLWVDYALNKLRDSDTGGNPVEKTKQYIIDHLSSELTMGELAKNVHLNADYLTRIFKKQMGYSINRYIIECRMKSAIWMLQNTSLSIGDVAAQVGYYNYSSFNRIFSKVMNMSPSEYKNSLK